MIKTKFLALITTIAVSASILLTGCGTEEEASKSKSTASTSQSVSEVSESESVSEIVAPGNSISDYDDGLMRADMTAMAYAKEMGIGINLGNTFESYWENLGNATTGAQVIGSNTPQDYEKCWGAIETTKECIDGMKAAGFNTIRIPVYWGNMMADNGQYQISDDYIGRVHEIVEYCREQSVYVVINIHHYDEFLIETKDKEEVLGAVSTLWEQIATYFAEYSDYVIFEGFNEALGTSKEGTEHTEAQAYEYVNAMNQTFVDAVRKTGGNNASRLLIVSGYWTNIDYTTKSSFVIPTDSVTDRIMVSVHYIDNVCYWGNRIGGEYWKSYSTAQCELLKAAFIDKNIPVFVGECTGIYEADRFANDASVTTSSECLSYIMNMALDYGFVPVIWDVCNGFYSRTDCKIKNQSDADVISALAKRVETQ